MAGMVFILSIPSGKCEREKRNKKFFKKDLLETFNKNDNNNKIQITSTTNKLSNKNNLEFKQVNAQQQQQQHQQQQLQQEQIKTDNNFDKKRQLNGGRDSSSGSGSNSGNSFDSGGELIEKANKCNRKVSTETINTSSECITFPKQKLIENHQEEEERQIEQEQEPEPEPTTKLIKRKILSSVTDCELKKTRSYECLGDENKTPKDEAHSLRKSWEGIKGLISTGKKEKLEKILKYDDNRRTITLSENSTMEEVVRESLNIMEIRHTSWILSQDEQNIQIIFSMESTSDCEKLLGMLNEWGIGSSDGSSISVLPCTIYHKPQLLTPTDDDKEPEITDSLKEKSAWEKFLLSIRARLNVAQIVEEVKKEARITFDFVCLLIVAAILAAFGLTENSTIFLASSMLISPLMGPIIAAIFGTVIKDRKLQYIGVINELIGIFLATFVGFLFGIIECSIYSGKYSSGEDLTKEMTSRCDLHSLIVGIFTALPSGAAVAIAILGENIGSLVGVAISASLLPPAVNAGVFWALSVVYAIFQNDETKFKNIVPTKIYSEHQSVELAVYGLISMGLTIINVICIYVMGVLFLKIKEVAPIASRNHRQFWKHDIKIARDYYKTCQSEDALSLSKKLADEIATLKHETDYEGMDNLTSQIYRNNLYHQQHQNTWSPLSNRHHQYTLMEPSKPAVQDLEALFNTSPQQQHSRPITFRRQSLMGKTISPPFTNKEILSYLNHERDCGEYRRISHPFEHLTVAGHYYGSFRSASVPLDKIIENIQAGGNSSHHTTTNAHHHNNHNHHRLALPPKNEAAVIEIDERKILKKDTSSGSLTKKFIVTPAAIDNDF